MPALLAQGPLPVTSLLALLGFGIALLLVLILRFKMQAFLALLIGSIVVATGAVFVNGKSENVKIKSGAPGDGAIVVHVPDHGRAERAIIAISGAEPTSFNGKWKITKIDGDEITAVAKDKGVKLPTSPLVKPGGITNPYAMSLTEIGQTIQDAMGGALGFIATIIGMGAIFGALLQHSGGTQALANTMLKRFGEKRAPWAMLVTGFIVSIPVFLDVALVILAPLLYALARDTKKPLLIFGLPLVAGMAVTHAFVPPTPGPVAVGYMLGVNLGWVILFGIIVGIPTAIICGPPLCSRVAKFVNVPLPAHAEAPEEEEEEAVNLPPFSLILGLIALPIVLILCNTIVEQIHAAGVEEGLSTGARKKAVAAAIGAAPIWHQVIHFLGHPIIALLISTLLATYFLAARRGADKQVILKLCTNALGPAGIIILITGAGGVFKGVLIKPPASPTPWPTRSAAAASPLVVLAYLFATAGADRPGLGHRRHAHRRRPHDRVHRTGRVPADARPRSPCAIAAGATTGFSHVNDSGFWIISRYFGMSEAETLKTWTLVSTAISVVAFAIIFALSFFF